MAKTSKIVRNQQRQKTVEKYAQRRQELKARSVNPHLTPEERADAMAALHALPRNASPTRLRNRDAVDGRPADTSEKQECPASDSANSP